MSITVRGTLALDASDVLLTCVRSNMTGVISLIKPPSNRGRVCAAAARSLLAAERLERLADAVARRRRIVRHELHLHARRGQLDHRRRLVAALADLIGELRDRSRLVIERGAPGRSHRFEPAARVGLIDRTARSLQAARRSR